MRKPKRGAIHVPGYVEIQPVLEHVRTMNRFFREVVDATPATRAVLPPLHVRYMEIITPLLAPHALDLALVVLELEEAFPEIRAALSGADR